MTVLLFVCLVSWHYDSFFVCARHTILKQLRVDSKHLGWQRRLDLDLDLDLDVIRHWT